MEPSRFSSQNYHNPTFTRRRVDRSESSFQQDMHQNNCFERTMPTTTEDWDQEYGTNATNTVVFTTPTLQTSSYDQSTSSSIAKPIVPSSLNSYSTRRQHQSQTYLIKRFDIPALIGKAGANIKQIQRDQNVQIHISNDRESQWVDFEISGSNDQAIQQALMQIRRYTTEIKDKHSQNQPVKSNSNTIGENSSSNSSFHFSRRNQEDNGGALPSRWNRTDENASMRSGTNQFPSANPNGFHSRGRGYSGSSKLTRSGNGRYAAPRAENDDEDYDALFGSDDEFSKKPSVEETQSIISAFTVTHSSSNSNGNGSDTVKRIDWTKMRRTDTSNDMSKWKDFPPVIKDFYHELPEITMMSEDEIQALCAQKNNIVVSWFDPSKKEEYEQKNNRPLKIPNPIYDFVHAFHNYPDILQEIAKQGFTEPSPIQCQAWPIAMSGFDFIGIAQTGTGKTLAFLLPALIHIDNQPKISMSHCGPKALILSPTRELAIQIHQEVQKYNYRGIRSAVIYGGSSRKQQIFQCETGVEIIIATPGRLNDLIMSNVIDVRSVTFLVLDEADRMLDMGFEPQIMKILLDIRPDRHTIMTSATWPPEVRRIAARYMRNPIQIYIGSLDLAAVHSVHQDIEIVKEEEKFDMLLDFIARMNSDDKVIVFVDRKSTADSIASELIRKHIPCQSIHGDREQSDREQALEDLKLGTVNILIATDVASRGLDIQDITVVFNYDLPKSMEDYVHRVGRTGRAGRTGYAISLVTRENWGSAGRLIKILEEAGQNVPDELRDMAERFKAMQDRKREFGGNRNRYGNRDNPDRSGFSEFGSTSWRGNGQNDNSRNKLPVMNSGWSFSN